MFPIYRIPLAIAISWSVYRSIFFKFDDNMSDNTTCRNDLLDQYHKNKWSYITTYNDVELYSKKVRYSNMIAFKGITTISKHIKELLPPFFDTSTTLKWVDFLTHIQEYPLKSPNNYNKEVESLIHILPRHERRIKWDIVHQSLSLPYPLKRRDLVMTREIVFDLKNKVMRALYASVDDNRFPLKDGVVRAETPFTSWKFTSINKNGECKTIIELETLSDAKLPIPSFLVNYLQKYWPSKALNKFKAVCAAYQSTGGTDFDRLVDRW